MINSLKVEIFFIFTVLEARKSEIWVQAAIFACSKRGLRTESKKTRGRDLLAIKRVESHPETDRQETE